MRPPSWSSDGAVGYKSRSGRKRSSGVAPRRPATPPPGRSRQEGGLAEGDGDHRPALRRRSRRRTPRRATARPDRSDIMRVGRVYRASLDRSRPLAVNDQCLAGSPRQGACGISSSGPPSHLAPPEAGECLVVLGRSPRPRGKAAALDVGGEHQHHPAQWVIEEPPRAAQVEASRGTEDLLALVEGGDPCSKRPQACHGVG